jgi:hypothetical protein
MNDQILRDALKDRHIYGHYLHVWNPDPARSDMLSESSISKERGASVDIDVDFERCQVRGGVPVRVPL